MSNSDLFQRVKDLQLPAGEYALFGSAPIGIRELKECQDVDIIMTPELLERCIHHPDWKKKTFEEGRCMYENEKLKIDVGASWGPGAWNILQLIKEAEIIDGLPFVRLEHVLAWKKILGREKDLRDVKIIEKFLRN
jgi:hypothetical protein